MTLVLRDLQEFWGSRLYFAALAFVCEDLIDVRNGHPVEKCEQVLCRWLVLGAAFSMLRYGLQFQPVFIDNA